MARPHFSRRLAIIVGATGLAAISARELIRPRPSSDHRLFDWQKVKSVAFVRSRESERFSADTHDGVAQSYNAYAAELAPAMAPVLGSPVNSYPALRALDRHDFIDINLAMIQRLVEPVEELRAQLPDSLISAWGRKVSSRYVGELFGFMSQRVLGQYDPALQLQKEKPRRETSLFLVEPNVTAFQQRTKVATVPLRRYLILHELTHAWQFESHPWLREHIEKRLHEMVMVQLLEQVQHQVKEKRPVDIRQTAEKLRSQVKSQISGLMETQALMSVLEGYANFVMNHVGRSELDNFDELHQAFHKRKSQRSALEKLIYAVTGINIKMRQYEAGEKFSEAVYKAGGYDLVNRVWTGPEMMPSMKELRKPEIWVSRVKSAG